MTITNNTEDLHDALNESASLEVIKLLLDVENQQSRGRD
jgi:hypothetical protein